MQWTDLFTTEARSIHEFLPSFWR